MKLTTIRELYRDTEAYLDKEITVGGWVRSVRDSKSFGFLVLHDGSFLRPCRSSIMIPWRILRRSAD